MSQEDLSLPLGEQGPREDSTFAERDAGLSWRECRTVAELVETPAKCVVVSPESLVTIPVGAQVTRLDRLRNLHDLRLVIAFNDAHSLNQAIKAGRFREEQIRRIDGFFLEPTPAKVGAPFVAEASHAVRKSRRSQSRSLPTRSAGVLRGTGSRRIRCPPASCSMARILPEDWPPPLATGR